MSSSADYEKSQDACLLNLFDIFLALPILSVEP